MKNRIGLGTYPLASVFSKISKDEAKNVVQAFIHAGRYYIDTAYAKLEQQIKAEFGTSIREFRGLNDKYY